MLYENNDRAGLGIAAISRSLDLKMPTAHNLMKTLVQLGYAEQGESGKYFPGPKADKFGMKSDSSLLEIARPQINSLVDAINETALLTVLHDGIRYTLYQRECTRELKVISDSTPNSNFFGTATGLAMICNLTLEQRRKFQAIDPNLLNHFSTEEALEQFLAQAREEGCVVLEKEEYIVFGVPLICSESGVIAAIGSFVPATRYNPVTRKNIIKHMLQTATAIKLCLS